MVSNPMQRKARVSFLLGMLLMLVILGAVIALLFLQLKNYQDEEAAEKAASVDIYVLNTDVKSGQIITSDMLSKKTLLRTLIPADAIGEQTTLDNYSLQDKEGNSVVTQTNNGEATLYLQKDGRNIELQQEDTTDSYYIEENGQKEYVELSTIPVVAKVSMKQNTVLTRELITKGNNTISDDIRRQEYNVVVLPTQLQTGDYIDIRLSLPTGQDYIVVSKKEVTIPTVDGTDSAESIWVNLSEEEILTMSSAIVDAFKIEGSKLYATTYTEPGLQNASTPTYSISAEAYALLTSNPNIVEEAKTELRNRYNVEQRQNINQNIQNSGETANENLNTKMQESVTKTLEERQQYLEGLSSEAATNTTTTE